MIRLMDTRSPWLDDDQQELWQALLTVVIALPAALDRHLQRDAGISDFEYGFWLSWPLPTRPRCGSVTWPASATAPSPGCRR